MVRTTKIRVKINGNPSKALGTIDLGEESIRVYIPQAMEQKKASLTKPFLWAISIPTRTYYFSANSSEDRQGWINAVQTNVDILNAS